MGLREERKLRTRRQIADTAWTLFADHGFDHVTVAQVAKVAQVSEATVFNYFDTKEDLFFYRLDEYGQRLVDAIMTRPPEETVLDAFHRLVTTPSGLLGQLDGGDPKALDRLRTVNRVIAASPALQAREQLSLARTADLLADRLAAATGGDGLTARVVAHAVLGLQRSLVLMVREVVLNGDIPPGFGRQVSRAAADALARLEQGLAGYGAATRRAG